MTVATVMSTNSAPADRADVSRENGRRRRRAVEPIRICCCPKYSWCAAPKCGTHIKLTLAGVALCVALIAILLYDMIHLATLKHDYSNFFRGQSNEELEALSDKQIERRYTAIENQEAMAIALLILLLLLTAASVAIFVSYTRRKTWLLLPFLILTFPTLTFSMIYAIIFRSMESGVGVFIKIVAVVFIYTILANIYRGVYRLFQQLRRSQAREQRRRDFADDLATTGRLENVVLRMKPPPYEKEPPPYSLEPPSAAPPSYDEPSSSHATPHGDVTSTNNTQLSGIDDVNRSQATAAVTAASDVNATAAQVNSSDTRTTAAARDERTSASSDVVVTLEQIRVENHRETIATPNPQADDTEDAEKYV